jgi:PAS domain S-box-containing protein
MKIKSKFFYGIVLSLIFIIIFSLNCSSYNYTFLKSDSNLSSFQDIRSINDDSFLLESLAKVSILVLSLLFYLFLFFSIESENEFKSLKFIYVNILIVSIVTIFFDFLRYVFYFLDSVIIYRFIIFFLIVFMNLFSYLIIKTNFLKLDLKIYTKKTIFIYISYFLFMIFFVFTDFFIVGLDDNYRRISSIYFMVVWLISLSFLLLSILYCAISNFLKKNYTLFYTFITSLIVIILVSFCHSFSFFSSIMQTLMTTCLILIYFFGMIKAKYFVFKKNILLNVIGLVIFLLVVIFSLGLFYFSNDIQKVELEQNLNLTITDFEEHSILINNLNSKLSILNDSTNNLYNFYKNDYNIFNKNIDSILYIYPYISNIFIFENDDLIYSYNPEFDLVSNNFLSNNSLFKKYYDYNYYQIDDDYYYIFDSKDGSDKINFVYLINLYDYFENTFVEFDHDNLFLVSNDEVYIYAMNEFIVDDELKNKLLYYTNNESLKNNVVVSYHSFNNSKYLMVKYPLVFLNNSYYSLISITSDDDIKPVYTAEKIKLISFSVFIFIVIIFIGVIITLNVTKSLRKEIDWKTKELKKMNKSLENEVSKRTKELYLLNNNLENKVFARTKEYDSKVKLLENHKVATMNILEDLSEALEKNEMSEAKYRTIVENINDGLLIINIKGNIISVNNSFSKLVGYSEKQLLNKNISIFFNEFNVNDVLKIINELKSKGSDVINTEIIDKNKKIKSVSIGFKFISNNSEYKIQAIIRDITDIKKAENKIKELNKNLEKKVDERTHKLKTANKKIQALLDMKSQFVNQVAHDLRTPLTPISSLLPIIKDKLKTKKDQEMMTIVLNNAKYLSNILTDTLNISRIDAGTVVFNYELYNISDIIKDVISNNDVVFKEHNIKIVNHSAKKEILVYVDRIKIMEVLENLIANSIKFMDKDKNVLSFDVKENKSNVVVCVHDNGLGISKEQLPKIFDEFYKADQSRHEHSSGLGLAICRRIIKNHNGKIWAESEGIEKGTSILFSLSKKKFKNTKVNREKK